jgi:hypothetical protein
MVRVAGTQSLHGKDLMTVYILVFYQLLYNREEAAEMLGLSVRKVDQLVARGILEPRRIDECVRFYVLDLIQFASNKNSEPASEQEAAEDGQ